jgi:polyhydroxyalkanoate synthesis regulator phasin
MSILKRMMLMGVGAATLSKAKAEEIAEELVKRGEVAAGDKAKVIEEIQQRAHATAADIRKMIDEQVEAAGKKFRWIDDLRKLQTTVEELNTRVSELEKTMKERGTTGN